MFNERKTTQAAAYLINKEGGTMSHMKLIKLLYLSDRKSYDLFNCPITGDDYYSMKNGPVVSQTLDLINGYIPNSKFWKRWITARENHQVAVSVEIDFTNEYVYDELSESDIEVMDHIFNELGHYHKFELVDYTHNPDNVPEWQKLNDSRSVPIKLETLLGCLGKSRSEIEEIQSIQSAKRDFDAILIECR